jgi:hypothetical protein
MKAAVLAICAWAIAGGYGAYAAETPADINKRGYRECDLGHLSLCQNTNQLVWGPAHRKAGFDWVLKEFLRGAPRIHLSKYSWSASEIARDSLTGPGDRPTRLTNGAWFFWGFTPHDAPDCAAIIFDRNGVILLVATLSVTKAAQSTRRIDPSRHVVTIYAHRPEPSPQLVQRVRNWAKESVAAMYSYPGLPKNVLVGTRMLTYGSADGRWDVRWLDR